MKTLTGFIIEKLKITKDVQDNVSNFLDGFDASSIQYWKLEIGLDPTKVDYTQNDGAKEIILRFGKANKIEQLFDYLAAGCPEFIPNESGIKDWLNFVATTDINDFETYNGKIEEKLCGLIHHKQDDKDIYEKLFINKNKKDVFSTLKPVTKGCYNMFKVQLSLITYEKKFGKSYDLTSIYNEMPIYNHGTREYEVQDITSTDSYIWLGVINKENGKPNEFEFKSLSFLATILGKGDETRGCAVINYVVDDIENMLE